MTFQPNPEQQEAIDCREGAWLWLAGAGSGKTQVLTERVKKLLMSGEPINEILALTFTAEAADNMLDRLQIKMSKSERFGFKTFHSFGLKVIFSEKDNMSFRLAENPFESMNGTKVIRDLLRSGGKKVSKQDLQKVQSAFSRIKRSSVVLPPSFPKESVVRDHKEWGFLYPEYVRRMRVGGWIDFDDMLVEAVNLLEKPEIRERWQFKFLLVDESQDTDSCHPPGTLIRKVIDVRSKPVLTADVPIETLKSGDRVVAWNRTSTTLAKRTKPIGVSVRNFEGSLLEVQCGHLKTRVTPDHKFYVTMSGVKDNDLYLVYLMYRKDLGFRVGQCAMRYSRTTPRQRKSMNGLGSRFAEERAERGWVLRVCSTREESLVWEQVISCNFGIPYATYGDKTYNSPFRRRTALVSRGIFKNTAGRGKDCLDSHSLMFDYPLFTWEKSRGKRKSAIGRRKGVSKRYFETAACNLIPEIMSLPSVDPYTQTRITSIKKVPYKGPVYSLNVPRFHTYVADGLVVKNCQFRMAQLISEKHKNVFFVGDINQALYGFRGAKPENLEKFAEWFPGAKVRVLPENYRSSPQLVEFGRLIAPIKNELVQKMRTNNPSGPEVEIKRYNGTAEEVTKVLEQAAKDPGNSAILARTNQQVGFFETECTLRGVKFHLLGKSGFWKTAEIRNVLGLARFLAGEDKPDGYGQQLVQHLRDSRDQEPGAYLDQIIMAANLRDMYSNDEYEDEANFALGNLDTIVQIAYRFEALTEFLEFANRASRASRKSKHAITLGTIHAAKGLEWDNVFVVGVQEGRIPHEKSSDMQEEQRILYVSVSRPRKRLHISYVGAISRFLEDLEDENGKGTDGISGEDYSEDEVSLG